MSYYIKGDKERGKEVIAMLEAKGGVNKYGCGGEYIDNLYFINKEGVITTCCINIGNPVFELCEELTLPEKPKWKPKFKIGDYVRIGYESIPGVILSINTDKHLYNTKYFDGSGEHYYGEDLLKTWEPKRGERVLVRLHETDIWTEGIFSFYEENNINRNYSLYYLEGGNKYFYCIPFDINKLGKI